MRRTLFLIAAVCVVAAACGSDDDGGSDDPPTTEASEVESPEAPDDPELAAARQLAIDSVLTLDDLPDEWGSGTMSLQAVEAALETTLTDIDVCQSLSENSGGGGGQRAYTQYESDEGASLATTVLVFAEQDDATTYYDRATDDDAQACLLEVVSIRDGEAATAIEVDEIDDVGDRATVLRLAPDDDATQMVLVAQTGVGVVQMTLEAPFPVFADAELALVVDRLASGLDN